MTNNNIGYIVVGIFILTFFGCSETQIQKNINTNYIDVNDVDSITLVSPPINMKIPGKLKPSIGLLAVNRGLVITPFSIPGVDTLSYFLDHDLSICCPMLHPLLVKGKGPGEASMLTAASKSMSSDSLIYFSSTEAKFIFFDEELTYSHERNISEAISVKGNFITKNRRALVSQNPRYNNGKIFKTIDLRNEETTNMVSARIPINYEPQIRNRLSAMTLIPDGVAFSYVGDQEILFMNKSGTISRSLNFGPNEPIKMWKADIKQDGAWSKAYIRKIEFNENFLFVLYRNNIFIFSYPELIPKKRLIIYSNNNNQERTTYITDFSVYEDLLYISFLGINISQIKIRNSWLN